MTVITVKTTNLESKRTMFLRELSILDAKTNELKTIIKDMSSNSSRSKDKLFHFELKQLKQKLEIHRKNRQEVRNSIGKLNRMIKNKHRFENGNLKAML